MFQTINTFLIATAGSTELPISEAYEELSQQFTSFIQMARIVFVVMAVLNILLVISVIVLAVKLGKSKKVAEQETLNDVLLPEKKIDELMKREEVYDSMLREMETPVSLQVDDFDFAEESEEKPETKQVSTSTEELQSIWEQAIAETEAKERREASAVAVEESEPEEEPANESRGLLRFFKVEEEDDLEEEELDWDELEKEYKEEIDEKALKRQEKEERKRMAKEAKEEKKLQKQQKKAEKSKKKEESVSSDFDDIEVIDLNDL